MSFVHFKRENGNILIIFHGRLVGERLVGRGHSVTQLRWAGSNMRGAGRSNVTVVTLPINTTLHPCRYINSRGEFDFQSRDMNLVRWEYSLKRKLNNSRRFHNYREGPLGLVCIDSYSPHSRGVNVRLA